MMCESAMRLPSLSWINGLINSQGYVDGERYEECVIMNDSYDPIDLMPADPYEINPGSTYSTSAGWIGYDHYDYDVVGDPYREYMEKIKINGSQVSQVCGRDENRVKMNSSFDPIDLLPSLSWIDELINDSQGNVDGVRDGSKYSTSAGWIGYDRDDDDASGDPFLDFMEKIKINGSQVSEVCGRVEDWMKMNSSFDPIDLLPSDPFEMNMVSESDISERISGIIERWIACSTFDCMEPAVIPAQDSGSYVGNPLFSSFEIELNSAADFNEASHLVPGDENIGPFDVAEDGSVISYTVRTDHHDGDVNCMHEGLLLSLEYLGVRDLLSVERVCKSLRCAVQNDPFLWGCIHIDSSMGENLTDDDLYRLTQRAEGNLRCLSLVQCPNITFDGLKRVLDSNPMLKKVNVPGCIRLNPDEHIKDLKTSGMQGINSPTPVNHFIGSVEDFEEMRLQVFEDEPLLTKARKLHFFHDEICQSKGPDQCRAGCACIERCADCNRCLDNCYYTETFLLNNICWVCANRSLERLKEKGFD